MKRKKYIHNIVAKKNETSLSNKELKHIVESHIVKYKKIKLQLECFEALSFINENIKHDKESLLAYVTLIEKIVNSLSLVSKEVIMEEYLSNKKNENWWAKKYSRSTFFKVKQMAIYEFAIYVL